MVQSFALIGAIAVLLNVLVLVLIDPIMRLLQIPADVWGMMHGYLSWVFWGITATFVYNYFATNPARDRQFRRAACVFGSQRAVEHCA